MGRTMYELSRAESNTCMRSNSSSLLGGGRGDIGAIFSKAYWNLSRSRQLRLPVYLDFATRIGKSFYCVPDRSNVRVCMQRSTKFSEGLSFLFSKISWYFLAHLVIMLQIVDTWMCFELSKGPTFFGVFSRAWCVPPWGSLLEWLRMVVLVAPATIIY